VAGAWLHHTAGLVGSHATRTTRNSRESAVFQRPQHSSNVLVLVLGALTVGSSKIQNLFSQCPKNKFESA